MIYFPMKLRKTPTILCRQKIETRINEAPTSTSLSVIVVIISKYAATMDIKSLIETNGVSTEVRT